MTTYVIFRHGSNAANQHMSEVEPVAVVDAPNLDAAIEAASEMPWTVAGCYNNQWLEARPWAWCKKDTREFAQESMEMGQERAENMERELAAHAHND